MVQSSSGGEEETCLRSASTSLVLLPHPRLLYQHSMDSDGSEDDSQYIEVDGECTPSEEEPRERVGGDREVGARGGSRGRGGTAPGSGELKQLLPGDSERLRRVESREGARVRDAIGNASDSASAALPEGKPKTKRRNERRRLQAIELREAGLPLPHRRKWKRPFDVLPLEIVVQASLFITGCRGTLLMILNYRSCAKSRLKH